MKYTKNVVLKNGRSCIIRNASADDAGEVLELFVITHGQTDFLSSYEDEAAFDADFERKFLEDRELSDREVYLCAVVDGCIAGCGSVSGIGGSKTGHRAEFGVMVNEKHWGLGIGGALTEACIECAKNAGYSQLELDVVSDNVSAMSLYRKMGFVEFGRNPRGFKSRYSGFQELVSMRMELDQKK